MIILLMRSITINKIHCDPLKCTVMGALESGNTQIAGTVPHSC